VRLSPELTGGGEEFSIQILAAPQTAEWLLVVLLLRTVIFPISYASGTPGGIFAPQLAFGALLGLLYGFAVGMLMPQLHLEGGRYAVSGMAALLTATVRAPLTGLALVVEMTGNYPLTLMALLTSVVADVTATLLAGKPVYETLLARTIALEGHPDDQHAASR
jgi:CIC family chloride channel protein